MAKSNYLTEHAKDFIEKTNSAQTEARPATSSPTKRNADEMEVNFNIAEASSDSSLSEPPTSPPAAPTFTAINAPTTTQASAPSALDERDEEDEDGSTSDLEKLAADPTLGDGEVDMTGLTSTSGFDVFDLVDEVYSALHGMMEKRGKSDEVKESIHYAICSIQRGWGTGATAKSIDELMLTARQAVLKSGEEPLMFGDEPGSLDEMVRHEVAGGIRKLLKQQEWTTIPNPHGKEQRWAVKEDEIEAVELVRKGMDYVMQEVRDDAPPALTTGTSSKITSKANGEGRPRKRQRLEGSIASSAPRQVNTATGGKIKQEATGNGTVTKSTKRKGGAVQEWGVEEAYYCATKWFKDDLFLDTVKCKDIKREDRAADHNKWIEENCGEKKPWERTWASLEQQMQTRRGRKETMQSLAAAAAQAAAERAAKALSKQATAKPTPRLTLKNSGSPSKQANTKSTTGASLPKASKAVDTTDSHFASKEVLQDLPVEFGGSKVGAENEDEVAEDENMEDEVADAEEMAEDDEPVAEEAENTEGMAE